MKYYTYDEIAEELGLTPTQVMSKVHWYKIKRKARRRPVLIEESEFERLKQILRDRPQKRSPPSRHPKANCYPPLQWHWNSNRRAQRVGELSDRLLRQPLCQR